MPKIVIPFAFSNNQKHGFKDHMCGYLQHNRVNKSTDGICRFMFFDFRPKKFAIHQITIQ